MPLRESTCCPTPSRTSAHQALKRRHHPVSQYILYESENNDGESTSERHCLLYLLNKSPETKLITIVLLPHPAL